MKAEPEESKVSESPRSLLKRIVGCICIDGIISWQNTTGPQLQDEEPGIKVIFTRSGPLLKRKGKSHLQEFLEQNKVDWIWQSGNSWFIDLDKLKKDAVFLVDQEWATGVERVEPNEMLEERGRRVEFIILREDMTVNRQKKIFLSHKSEDKVMIRAFNRLLKELGFDPWLDEDAMPAGTHLERGLLSGFEDSCAAVFFITPNFKDENYLATEVDYAFRQKRKKGDRFSIITIVFKDKDGKSGVVPELLKNYVWKTPISESEALYEILKALPVEVGPVQWRAHFHPKDELTNTPAQPLIIKVTGFNARYMGQDAAAATCPKPKNEASFISYWLEINLLNSDNAPLNFSDIHIVFAKNGTTQLETVPGLETGSVRAGMRHTPEITTLTLPSKEWKKEIWVGGVGKDKLRLIESCDEIYLRLITVDGRTIKHPLGKHIQEPPPPRQSIPAPHPVGS